MERESFSAFVEVLCLNDARDGNRCRSVWRAFSVRLQSVRVKFGNLSICGDSFRCDIVCALGCRLVRNLERCLCGTLEESVVNIVINTLDVCGSRGHLERCVLIDGGRCRIACERELKTLINVKVLEDNFVDVTIIACHIDTERMLAFCQRNKGAAMYRHVVVPCPIASLWHVDGLT